MSGLVTEDVFEPAQRAGQTALVQADDAIIAQVCRAWADAFDYPDADTDAVLRDEVDKLLSSFDEKMTSSLEHGLPVFLDASGAETLVSRGEGALLGEMIHQFVYEVHMLTAPDLTMRQEAYVQLFDLSRDTSLYLTSRGRSDGPEQRADLLKYSVYFEEAGYEVEGVLPDYIGALLELMSVVDDLSRARIARGMYKDVVRLREALAALEAGDEPSADVAANPVDLTAASAGDDVVDRALDDGMAYMPCSACGASGNVSDGARDVTGVPQDPSAVREAQRVREDIEDQAHARANYQKRTEHIISQAPEILSRYHALARLLVSFLGYVSREEAE